MIFAAAGQEFEDDRIANFEAWSVIKPTTPLGQVPVLEVYEGSNLVFRMSQSIACARFLARRFDMAGSTEVEQAEVDMYADTSLDLFNAAVKIYFEKDPAKKNELKSKYLGINYSYI
jgi:glutathione S-transferase